MIEPHAVQRTYKKRKSAALTVDITGTTQAHFERKFVK